MTAVGPTRALLDVEESDRKFVPETKDQAFAGLWPIVACWYQWHSLAIVVAGVRVYLPMKAPWSFIYACCCLFTRKVEGKDHHTSQTNHKLLTVWRGVIYRMYYLEPPTNIQNWFRVKNTFFCMQCYSMDKIIDDLHSTATKKQYLIEDFFNLSHYLHILFSTSMWNKRFPTEFET